MNLQKKATQIRRDVINMICSAGKGHIGGSLSCVDILVAIYYGGIKFDKFILSKGHACPALYAILADLGKLDKKALKTFNKPGGLEGHPSIKTPGVDCSSGSLGHGLPIAAGMALAGKKVIVLVGDGEMSEGSNWEALLFISRFKLWGNIKVIIDCNGLGATQKVNLPLVKYYEVDGHIIADIINALNKPMKNILWAYTIKGKGLKEIEDKMEYHHKVPVIK